MTSSLLAKEREYKLSDGSLVVVSITVVENPDETQDKAILNVNFSLRNGEETIPVVTSKREFTSVSAWERSLESGVACIDSQSSRVAFTYIEYARRTSPGTVVMCEFPAWKAAKNKKGKFKVVLGRPRVSDLETDVTLDYLASDAFESKEERDRWARASDGKSPRIVEMECKRDNDLQYWEVRLRHEPLEFTFRRQVGYPGWYQAPTK
jgi:hypothetical protein